MRLRYFSPVYLDRWSSVGYIYKVVMNVRCGYILFVIFRNFSQYIKNHNSKNIHMQVIYVYSTLLLPCGTSRQYKCAIYT